MSYIQGKMDFITFIFSAQSARPCLVTIEETRQDSIQLKNKNQVKNPEIKCFYCGKTILKDSELHHMRNLHAHTYIKCPQFHCCTYFKSQKDKEEHLALVHAKTSRMKCVYCEAYLTDHKAQWSHMRGVHKDLLTIRCPFRHCPTYFKSQEEKQMHLDDVHHVADKVKCVYCNLAFTTSNINTHVSYAHAGVAIKCNFKLHCPTFFNSVEEREEHVKEVHLKVKGKKTFACVYCRKVFSGWPRVHGHVKRMHQDVAIKCQVFKCLRYFQSEDERDEHSKKVHSLKKLRCPQCEYKTNNKDCFKQHVSLKHGTEQLRCEHCLEKMYTSKLALMRHMRLIHLKKLYTCSHCKETLPTHRLGIHLLSESCGNCNEILPCVGSLRQHKVQCKVDKTCKICARVFDLPCNLRYHLKTSHRVDIDKWKGLEFESRGFDCQKCKRFFSTKSRLVEHRKNSHPPGEKKFECDLCHKSCKSRAGMLFHMKIFHLSGEMNFECSVCDLSFSSKEKLRYHCNYFHGRSNYIECDKCGKILMEKQKIQHDQTFH